MTPDLVIRGRRIRHDVEGRVSLNDLHEAARFSKNLRPSSWIGLPSAKQAIPAVLKLITGKSSNWTKSEIRSVYYTKVGAGGGTWAHENLALAYAEYLSPALAVEVRDVFLRYKRGDETLVNEIRANHRKAPTSDQELHRQVGKEVRRQFTDTLDAHGVRESKEYALCTNEVYRPLFGATAKQLKADRGIRPGSSLRDHMTKTELAFTMASEALASESIAHQKSSGFLECRKATRQATTLIAQAITFDRRNRK